MIGGLWSILFVSFFPGPLVVIIVMIDGSENTIISWVFELQILCVIERYSKAPIIGK